MDGFIMENPFEIILKRLDRIEAMIAEIQRPAIVENKTFNIDSLIQYLPFDISKPTVYRWVQNGEIPYNKVGKRLVFQQDKIDVWLKKKL